MINERSKGREQGKDAKENLEVKDKRAWSRL